MVFKRAVYFHFLVPRFHFPERTELKSFIERLFREEGLKTGTLNYIFCTDEYLLEVNKTYLNHNYYTDIITFPISEPNEAVSSDIYISVERVRENAVSFGSSFNKELHRVIFHGALHLCGYKDKSAEEAALMRKKEDEYLSRYFVPRGTKSR